jgi:type I restriction enzyme M protein
MTQPPKVLDRIADVVLGYKPKQKAKELKQSPGTTGKPKISKRLNERITEGIVRDLFRSLGYYDRPDILVEEQGSSIPKIDKLLQNASKRGSGKGYPEFIIHTNLENDFVCVVECKTNITKHQSETLTKYSEYAVDGAKLYADYLSKELDVLYIGVSGQDKTELKVSHYLKLKKERDSKHLFGNELLSFDSYLEQYKKERYRVDYESLIKYVQQLNGKLHAKKIPEHNRAILFSGILISLEDETFLNTYSKYTDAKRLSKYLVDSIRQKLEQANVPHTRVYEMDQAFSFIKSHTALIDDGYLIDLVKEIHENIRIFIKSHNYFDIISRVYVEFLKYANNDKSLGIVLTPDHITSLFCDIADVTKDSLVLDNCCGTGGFLVAAMQKMVALAKGDLDKISEIKRQQLLGIEYQDHIFTLCASNMIIHGDGKANIIKGDCFKVIDQVKWRKPTVGLLNPPYNDVTGIDELEFVLNNLDALDKNSTCVAIVPMSCALYQDGIGAEIKKRILDKHTLDAVMSMPTDLFYPVGVVTCVMVFKTHVPHSTNRKTWFGYWKNDGFIKSKHKGRIPTDKWKYIREHWLNSYRNREVIVGESVTHVVNHESE